MTCIEHSQMPGKALDYDGMAAAFGLSRTACFNIRNGRTYKDIT